MKNRTLVQVVRGHVTQKTKEMDGIQIGKIVPFISLYK